MATDEIEQRLAREREFHNARFRSDESRSSQEKYYWAVNDGNAEFAQLCANLARDKDVLEYGCGDTRKFLTLGASVRSLQAIDISDAAIERAKSENTRNNVGLHVMDAMNMTFADNSFDLVFGSGIIHHLDTEIAVREIARVLRPGGTAIFWEPLGHNPVFNTYRHFTPQARTPDEHPLVSKDFRIMAQHFSTLSVKYYGLTTLATVPIRNRKFGRTSLRLTRRFDRALFSIPGVKQLAWFSIVVGSK